MVRKLLVLAFIVAVGIGVFEVGLALRGKQELSLTQYQIALMFSECSLVMIVVQAAVFSPWVRPAITRWLILPALAVFAAGLLLTPRAMAFVTMLTVVGAVAASAGILSPILSYWLSRNAGRAQGWQFGNQTAAVSLGTATGSVAVGFLSGVGSIPDAAFLLTAAGVALGVLLSLRLPGQLVAWKPRAVGGGATPPLSEVTRKGKEISQQGSVTYRTNGRQAGRNSRHPHQAEKRKRANFSTQAVNRSRSVTSAARSQASCHTQIPVALSVTAGSRCWVTRWMTVTLSHYLDLID